LQAAHAEIFRKAYLGCLWERPRKRWFMPLLATLKFWLTLDRRKKLGKDLVFLEDKALRELSGVLSRLPTRGYKNVQRNLQSLEGQAGERWRRLQEDVRERQSGSLARLRRWLPRIPGFAGRGR
jgi:hypothetical protein